MLEKLLGNEISGTQQDVTINGVSHVPSQEDEELDLGGLTLGEIIAFGESGLSYAAPAQSVEECMLGILRVLFTHLITRRR